MIANLPLPGPSSRFRRQDRGDPVSYCRLACVEWSVRYFLLPWYGSSWHEKCNYCLYFVFLRWIIAKTRTFNHWYSYSWCQMVPIAPDKILLMTTLLVILKTRHKDTFLSYRVDVSSAEQLRQNYSTLYDGFHQALERPNPRTYKNWILNALNQCVVHTKDQIRFFLNLVATMIAKASPQQHKQPGKYKRNQRNNI